jgi:hypothetical protein
VIAMSVSPILTELKPGIVIGLPAVLVAVLIGITALKVSA